MQSSIIDINYVKDEEIINVKYVNEIDSLKKILADINKKENEIIEKI